MKTNINNMVLMVGEITKGFEYKYEYKGNRYYQGIISTKRYSGVLDNIPFVISEKLFDSQVDYTEKTIKIKGIYRSRNEHIDGKSKLILYVYATEFEILDDDYLDHVNFTYLDGYLCNQPKYRSTPLGRKITDFILAVQDRNKSYYIPIICWEKEAEFAGKLKIGNHVQIKGRIQSREFEKKIDEDLSEIRTAYEVSAHYIYLDRESEEKNGNQN